MKKKILALLIAALFARCDSEAVQLIQNLQDLNPQTFTSVSVSNAVTAQKITFAGAASEITIGCTPGGSNVYFTLSGTATTGNFQLPAGSYMTISCFPQYSISVIADGTAGRCSVLAH